MDFSNVESLIVRYGEQVESLGLSALRALIVVAVGYPLAVFVRRSLEGLMKRWPRMDPIIATFVARAAKWGVLFAVILIALQQFGVQPTSLLAVFGAAALAIGLALQGTLSNVAAGVMLASFRPYRVGDFVQIGDFQGTVREVAPFTTTITAIDNRRIIVPNAKAWGEVIVNFTAEDARRLDLLFDISYEDDIGEAIATIHDVLSGHPQVAGDPPIWIGVEALATSSVQIRARAWVATPDFVDVRSDILRTVKERFDASGIVIPYPHQVELSKEEARSGLSQKTVEKLKGEAAKARVDRAKTAAARKPAASTSSGD